LGNEITEIWQGWVEAAGLVYYGSCYCGGYTMKYRNGEYDLHVKPRNKRYHLKRGAKILAFGGIYNLEAKLYELGLIQKAEESPAIS
jgi:hypothetical protein